jgi:hypothetical protein
MAEKIDLGQDENSSSSNNENDFKELDNEIGKVIRGETPYDEENPEKTRKASNSDTFSQEMNKNKNNNIENINKKIIINNKINEIYNNNFNVQLLNQIQNSSEFQSINSESSFFNNFNINFQKQFTNNQNNNKSHQQSQNININFKANKDSFLFNLDGNCENTNSEFIYNNNMNKQEKSRLYKQNLKPNINGFDLKNFQLNNNLLFSNINNTINSALNQNGNQFTHRNRDTIINNEIFNPININVLFTNNMDNQNTIQYLNFLNQIKNQNFMANNNFLDNSINNMLYNYLKINNNQPNVNHINDINTNIINNLIYSNENIRINQLEKQIINNNLLNLMINNNNNLNSQNQMRNNSNINLNNNKVNYCNNEKNTYNHDQNENINKRKIFNPLPDSEKEKNIINLLDIFKCKDSRTTLMIKNIPNKYTISLFLEEINKNFKNEYDIFYLPIDYINKCNLGFAFINFIEPFHIILFYELYRGKKWNRFNSDKICELLYAKYQGRKELISHFEKGTVLSFESEEKRPLILPVPKNFVKIKIPIYYLDLFLKLYPNVSYRIKTIKTSDNTLTKVFSINGNFNKNYK